MKFCLKKNKKRNLFLQLHTTTYCITFYTTNSECVMRFYSGTNNSKKWKNERIKKFFILKHNTKFNKYKIIYLLINMDYMEY